MRFLERLAASAFQRARDEASASAVRVVLPSRFATRAGGAAPLEEHSMVDDGPGHVFSRDAVPAGPVTPPLGARAMPPDAWSEREGAADPPTGATERGAPTAGDRPRRDMRAVAAGSAPDPVSTAREVAAGTGASTALATDDRLQAARPTGRGEGGLSPSIVMRRPGAEAAPVKARTPHAPLSEAALLARLDAARDDGPVIEVTIDRIDVRTPAPPAHAPAERRRRPAPSVTLTDYLRGRGRSGGQE